MNLFMMKLLYLTGQKQLALKWARGLIQDHAQNCPVLDCTVELQALRYVEWQQSRENKRLQKRSNHVTS